jgi:hypothetical protein
MEPRLDTVSELSPAREVCLKLLVGFEKELGCWQA